MASRMARRQPVGQPLRPSLGQGPGKELQGCALMAQIASGAVGASRAIMGGSRQFQKIGRIDASLMTRLRSVRVMRRLLGPRRSGRLRRHPHHRQQAHGQQSEQKQKGDTAHRQKIVEAVLSASRAMTRKRGLRNTARSMISPKTGPAVGGQTAQRSGWAKTASIAGGKCSGAGKCSACQPKALAASTLARLSSTNQVRFASSPCRSASSV